MKKLGFWLALMSAAAVPLFTYMSQRQQSKQSRLQSLAGSARDRAAGAGESALDTLGDLAGTARDRLGIFGEASRQQAESATQQAGSLVGKAGTLLAGAPRIVAQIRGGDDDDSPYGSRDDWRKYGDVFPR
jgi:hypothetical protein